MFTSQYLQKVTSNSVDCIKQKNNFGTYLPHYTNRRVDEIQNKKSRASIDKENCSKAANLYENFKTSNDQERQIVIQKYKYEKNKSLFIQSCVKKTIRHKKTGELYPIKSSYFYEIISNILNQRVWASKKIQNFYKKKSFSKKIKILYLFKKIITQRSDSIIKIQKNVKMYLCKKSINSILKLKKKNWGVFYYASPNSNSVKINIEHSHRNQKIKLNYNRILRMFYFFLKKMDYPNRIYKFNFEVDGKAFIDMNFESVMYPDGKIYNILDIALLKSKSYLSNILEQTDQFKFCHPVRPMRALTSPQVQPISSILSKNKLSFNPKSILKKNSFDDINLKKRKVSFNLEVEYCE